MAHLHPQRYPGSVWAESVVFEALEHLSNEWHVVADAFFPVERRHQALSVIVGVSADQSGFR